MTTQQTQQTRTATTHRATTAKPAATQGTSQPAPDKMRPVQEIRLGTIKAAIWANATQRNSVMYTVTLQRIYKTGGLWKRSDTYRRDDLLTVGKVLDLAHSWIHRQQAETTRRTASAA